MSTVKLDTKKIVFTIIWCVVGIAIMVLLVAAVRSKDVKLCKGVNIEIIDVSNNFFIDKGDVLGIIKNYVGGRPEGRYINKFNLAAIEAHLEKDVWIKDAELFFDNNEVLRVSVYEREPVSRVFATDGSSFYLDTSLKVLPLSEKFSARLPVFTGFTNTAALVSKADSNTFKAINKISMALQADSFLMAMIEQVDITPQQNFEMIPKIGNQVIVLGQAQDIEQKLSKLKLFYKDVITKVGWSKYSVINLQYKNQVVAKIKDAADKTSDSLRALQIMQLIAERSARQAADSALLFAHQNERNVADSSMIQQSVQREDEGMSEEPLMLNSPVKDTIFKAATAVTKKPAPAKPATPKPVVPKPVVTKPAAKPTATKPAAAKPATTK
ncbi:MAG: hypothetical protein EOO03_07870, partial [Chitinophagaceae bacterium]